jgi:hypothetical protein
MASWTRTSGALGEARDGRKRNRVAGERDRSVAEVEAIGERRFDRRMLHDLGCDLDVLGHRTRRRDLTDLDHAQRRHMEVFGPEVDGRFGKGHEIGGHLLQRRRPEGPHRKGHALHPADHEERPELDVVVGMVVGDEDRAELLEGEPGLREAVGDPEPAVEHIGDIVAEHDMGRHAPGASRYRAGAGAEQHELGTLRVRELGRDLGGGCRLCCSRPSERGQRRCGSHAGDHAAAAEVQVGHSVSCHEHVAAPSRLRRRRCQGLRSWGTSAVEATALGG